MPGLGIYVSSEFRIKLLTTILIYNIITINLINVLRVFRISDKILFTCNIDWSFVSNIQMNVIQKYSGIFIFSFLTAVVLL